jgi:aspartate/methionine/tyrosine aminotransferase
MAAVQAPIIPIVADLIRRHPGTLSLGQGVVSYGPPPEAMQGLTAGMSQPDNHKYRPVAGVPELVEALWEKLARENGVTRAPEHALMVTAGSNLGFMNVILAIVDPGDEVILQSPYYFNHEMAVNLASARPVLVKTDARYQLRLSAIRQAITSRTRAIVTISPNNPTGAVYPRADLEAVNRLCAERGLYHIHDEAYEYFTHGEARHFSPASIPGSASHTVSLFSMSKGYGFASWRIGCLLAPSALLDPLMKIQDTLLICAPVPSQFAAIGALSAGRGWVERQLGPLRAARAEVQAGLATLGPRATVPEAEGAFYFLMGLDSDWDPLDLTRRLVEDHRVAVVPGTAFGAGGCRLRISYGALTPDTAREATARLVRGLRTLCKL